MNLLAMAHSPMYLTGEACPRSGERGYRGIR